MNLISEQIHGANIAAIDISELNHQYPEINHMIDNNYPIIELPFPPVIEPKDLIVNKKSPQDSPNGKQSRAPNAFIIYRKAFVKAARDQGYILPMTVISTMASASWEKESSLVKEEYKKLAKDTHKLIKEMFPKKPNQRKRKEKWNLVSFQNKSLNDDNNKTKKEFDDITITTQELTAINDNDNNNVMIDTPLTSVSSIFTTATSSPNLSECDGNISEKSLALQQQSIPNEGQISDDYLIDELNNTYLPNSFQDYLNSYLPGEDNQGGSNFLLKSWLNQSKDCSEFTLEELFDTTNNLKEYSNSPTSLNMTLAEAMGIINSENFKEDLENFQF